MAELRKRGLVTGVICSTPFMRLGATQARTFGTPDLALIEIPHPLGGLDLQSVQGRAGIAVPQIVNMVKKLLE